MEQATTAHYKLTDRGTNYVQQQQMMMLGLTLVQKEIRAKLAHFEAEEFSTIPARAIPNPENPDDETDWLNESDLLNQLHAAIEAQENLADFRKLTTRKDKNLRFVSEREIAQTRRVLEAIGITSS